MASATASAIANAATRSALEGSSFGDNLVAAVPDAVGQALGGYLGSQFQAKSSYLQRPPVDLLVKGDPDAPIVADMSGLTNIPMSDVPNFNADDAIVVMGGRLPRTPAEESARLARVAARDAAADASDGPPSVSRVIEGYGEYEGDVMSDGSLSNLGNYSRNVGAQSQRWFPNKALQHGNSYFANLSSEERMALARRLHGAWGWQWPQKDQG